MSVGIGRGPAPDPLHLDRSFTEARRALAIGRWGHGPGKVTAFDDLGLDRLLVGVAGPRDRRLLRRRSSDRSRRTTRPTVRTSSRPSMPTSRPATWRWPPVGLYVHYNTLKNRLIRIEEIIGPYIDDSDRCLGLALALRLRKRPTP